MSTFADSSALVKLYADESQHQAVRSLAMLVVSELARVEVPAAIWRKHRMGELQNNAAAVLVAEFEADYFGTAVEARRFLVVPVSSAVLETSARLVRVHGLRAHDSVQLASAMKVSEIDPACCELAAFDSGLRKAAAAEGFALVPEE